MVGVLEYANMSRNSIDSFRGGVYCVWSVSGCVCMLCTVYGVLGGSIYKCFVIV